MCDETRDATQDGSDERESAAQRPGLVVVFDGHAPSFVPQAYDGGALSLGRGMAPFARSTLDRLSRHHAQVERALVPGGGFVVRDCGSRNGTFVDGVKVEGSLEARAPRVLRLADALLVFCEDVQSLRSPTAHEGGVVIGSRLRAALDEVTRAASSSATLLLRGESGTGKEMAARAFHRAGPRAAGPLVPVNCAAIPAALAERLLFGTRRGAYSGASTDARGHVQEADGGVLFLDEGGELDAHVQATLLRVLETRQVMALGASHGTSVDIGVCIATHRDLRAAVAEGRFRADLYHRIAPPEVVLPPLRERLDEIVAHVATEIAQVSPALSIHVRFFEACLLRPWPGNVRELRKEVRAAGLRALAEGREQVRLEHLSDAAGLPFQCAPADAAPAGPEPAPPSPPRSRGYVRWSMSLAREDVERALAAHEWSVTEAARALGMGRTQLYRIMTQWGLVRPERGKPVP